MSSWDFEELDAAEALRDGARQRQAASAITGGGGEGVSGGEEVCGGIEGGESPQSGGCYKGEGSCDPTPEGVGEGGRPAEEAGGGAGARQRGPEGDQLKKLLSPARRCRAVGLLIRIGTEFGDDDLGDCLLSGVESIYEVS